MPIKLPAERTYYAASAEEPDSVLVWVPPDDLMQFARSGLGSPSLLDEYPNGLEIAVSEATLRLAGLVLPAEPDALIDAYAELRQQGRLPASGYIRGTYLEELARRPAPMRVAAADMRGPVQGPPLGPAPEPRMSPGEEPMDVLRRLGV
jgi:hypothetical protein